MRPLSIVLVAGLVCPVAAAAFDRPRNVAAGVELAGFDSDFEFSDGSTETRRFRRASIDYREGLIGETLWIGLMFGISENQAAVSATRPFENVSGNHAALALHYTWPVGALVSLKGRVGYLVERTDHATEDVDFEIRMSGSQAEVGAVLDYGVLRAAGGASWTDLDYREIRHESAGDQVRHATIGDKAGGFLSLGVATDQRGLISLRYDSGAQEGWLLRFERTFK